MEKVLSLPILGPLLNLLKSRKFMVGVITLVADMIVTQVPELQPIRTEIITVLTVVGSILISAIAYEDGKEKSATRVFNIGTESTDDAVG